MATNKDFIVKSGLQIQSTASATSISTGALQVAGGAGITGDLWVGGNIYLDGVGLDTIQGTTGTFKNIYVTGTNVSTSTTTGAMTVAGGLGVAGNIYGTAIYDNNARVLTTGTIGTYAATNIVAGTDTAVSASTGAITIWNTSTLQSITNRGSTTTNAVYITNATAATSTVTGALQVVGGAGIGGAVYAGSVYDSNNRVVTSVIASGSTYIGISNVVSTGTATSFTITNLGVQTITAGTDTAVSSSTGTVTIWNTSTLQSITNRGSTTTNVINITNTTDSTTTGTGALIVAGGVAVGKQLSADNIDIFATTDVGVGSGSLVTAGGVYIAKGARIDSTAASTSTAASNALYVAGGVYVGTQLTVGGTTLFKDNVTFAGTATYVYSTNTFYTDNILELHTPPGGVAANWTLDDGKDIGLRFHYYANSTDTNAALVMASDTKFLEWYNSGAEGANVFTSATYGTFKTGAIVLTSSTVATSTTTGALIVSGGVGIGGNVYAGALYDNGARVLTTATIGSSGVASIIAGADISVSSPTGNVTISGTSTFQTVTNRGATTTNAISITNATAASSTTTGALQVVGGVGIGGNLYVGGNIISTGSITGTISTTTNIAGGTAGTIPIQVSPGVTTFISTGSVGTILQMQTGNTSSFVSTGTLQVGYSVTATNIAGGTAGQIHYQSAPGATSFVAIAATGTVLVSNGTGAPAYQNTLTLAGTTVSTSTATGALQVVGGVGVGGSLYAGALYDSSNRVVTSVIATPGTGISVTTSSSTGTNVSFTIANTGVISLTAGNPSIGVSASSGAVTLSNLGVTSIAGTAGQINVSASTGSVTLSLPNAVTFTTGTFTNLIVTGTAPSFSTNTGALQVVGGVGIGSSVYVGTTATVAGTLYRTGGVTTTGWGTAGAGLVLSTATYTDTSLTGAQAFVAVHSIGRPTIAATNTPTYTDAATLYIDNSPLASTSTVITNPWSLYVANGNVKIAATTVSGSSSAGALVVGGGVGIGGALNVAGAGSFASTGVTVGNTLISSYTSGAISTTSTQNLDTFTTSTFRSAKYTVQVVDAAKVHITEMTVFHDNTVVYKMEYGISSNTGELGTFDASLAAGTITLTFTPNYTPAAMIIKANRTSIAT